MKTRMALETELDMSHRRIDALKDELDEAYATINRLHKENYSLQVDNDIVVSALKAISTRKSAEIANRIMAYETMPSAYEHPVQSNDAELFAELYAKNYE